MKSCFMLLITDDPEEAWSITRHTILTADAANFLVKSCPWLTTETMDIVDQKKE